MHAEQSSVSFAASLYSTAALSSKRFQGTATAARTAARSASTQADTTPGAAAMAPSVAHMLKLTPSTIVRAR
eukprot:scaffold50111_cov42-Phaeocystis_antarctica.AAC.1